MYGENSHGTYHRAHEHRADPERIMDVGDVLLDMQSGLVRHA